MRTTAIVCDFCGNDLSKPTPMPDYYLTLQQGQLPTGPIVYSAYVSPPLPHDMHFCGMGCLTKWMEARDGLPD